MAIPLKEIFPIENTGEYKIHFARNNKRIEPRDGGEPLRVWVRSEAEWQGWQEYRPKSNVFSRRYIFSLMRFYHEDKKNTWLFGGIFRVIERYEDNHRVELKDRYKVELADIRKNLIGRLKIKHPYNAMQPRANMENYYDEFEVKEILPKKYRPLVEKKV